MIWRTPSSSLAPPDRWAGCWSSSGISTRGSRHLWPSGTRCAAGWRTVAPRAWCPWITGSPVHPFPAALDDAAFLGVVDAAEANLEQILASLGRLMRSQAAPT